MDLDEIKTQYSNARDKYEKLKDEVKYILEERLKAANIPYHMLDGRVKTLDSVLTKVNRQFGEGQTSKLAEIVDVCGVRVICLFLSDVEKIGKIIEEKFNIESKDDKILSKPQEEFGYLSVHYVGKLPGDYSGPRYDDIKELRFEIQVRTIAMHAWATISHYLDYKSPHSIPSDLRKDFYGLSALFYLADSHFELFFRKGQKAREAVEQKASEVSGIAAEEINLDTLGTYLKQRFPNREHSDSTVVSELVEELISAGYETIRGLDTDLQRSAHAFTLYEKEHPPDSKAKGKSFENGEKHIFADVGVVRASLEIANEKFLKIRKTFEESQEQYRSFRKFLK